VNLISVREMRVNFISIFISVFLFSVYFINCTEEKIEERSITKREDCDTTVIASFRNHLIDKVFWADSVWTNFGKAIVISECLGNRDSLFLLIADSLHNRGNALLISAPSISRIYFESATKIRREFYGDSIHIDILRSLINTGMTYVNEGDHILALAYFDSAEIEKSEFRIFPYIFNQIKKAESYKSLNEYLKAIECLSSAYQRIIECISSKTCTESEAWLKTSSKLEYLMYSLSDLYKTIGENRKSMDFSLKGIQLIRGWAPPSDTIGQMGNLFISIGNNIQDSLAEIQDRESEAYKLLCSQGINYYQLAFSNFKKLEDKRSILLCFQNLAALYEKMKDYTKSETLCRQGIEFANLNFNEVVPSQFQSLYINLGTALLGQDKFKEALMAYWKAVGSIDSSCLSNGKIPDVNKLALDYEQSLILLGSMGRAFKLLAPEDKQSALLAVQTYDTLANLLNHFRGNIINDNAKVNLAERSRLWIPDAITDIKDLYLLSNDSIQKEKMFVMVEQAKAFSLIEASRLNNAKDQLPIALQNKKEELLIFQQRALHNDSIAGLVEKKQREFFSELKLKVPSYFAIKYKGVDISIQDIQQNLLEENQAMLEYFIQDSLINIFLISKSHFIFDTVGILKTELEKLISSFRKSINPVNDEGTTDPKLVREFCLTSNQLYDILIGHVKVKYGLPERLIIIPDGILNNLSFDALLSKLSNDGNNLPLQAKDGNYLIQQHAISYCFSASMLQEMSRALRQNNLKTILAIIAPQFHSESKILPYLTYQSDEIAGIKAVYDKTYTDKKSTKEQFIRATEKYAYLHISTHGFVADDPDQSFISFSQLSPKPDSSQFLFLKELYNFPMNQELITLTACETALGQLKEGEGNISLARGFAYSGVKSFITTLWKINTHGASTIIPGFYHHFFNQAQPKDVALATSKREFLAEGKSVYPENWAGLILIGSSKRAVQSSDPAYWEICICAVILTLGWIFYMQRKRRLSA